MKTQYSNTRLHRIIQGANGMFWRQVQSGLPATRTHTGWDNVGPGCGLVEARGWLGSQNSYKPPEVPAE